jgi:D-aminoacyl-tRNA deacylase
LELYSAFFSKVKELYEEDKVKDGIFQAMMDVALVNDGPVGISYTSEDGVVMPLKNYSQKSLLTDCSIRSL